MRIKFLSSTKQKYVHNSFNLLFNIILSILVDMYKKPVLLNIMLTYTEALNKPHITFNQNNIMVIDITPDFTYNLSL